ncbi:MAG: hypothetical protein ABT20_11235 [Rubrivivax sp. SCN 70-15]|nr:MAG: hypothetical protein ABT20_11235 [Rubrivivax sp. SCN 70-15]
MNAYWPLLLAAVLAIALAAGAAVWLQHRRHLANLRRRLEDAEHSRFEISERTAELGERLALVQGALAAQQQALDASRDLAERRAALERALDRGRDSVPHLPWPDTQPMTIAPERACFAPTEPAELVDDRRVMPR